MRHDDMKENGMLLVLEASLVTLISSRCSPFHIGTGAPACPASPASPACSSPTALVGPCVRGLPMLRCWKACSMA
eukprot:880942-Pelagomonas_calceolata.AAC.1